MFGRRGGRRRWWRRVRASGRFWSRIFRWWIIAPQRPKSSPSFRSQKWVPDELGNDYGQVRHNFSFLFSCIFKPQISFQDQENLQPQKLVDIHSWLNGQRQYQEVKQLNRTVPISSTNVPRLKQLLKTAEEANAKAKLAAKRQSSIKDFFTTKQ